MQKACRHTTAGAPTACRQAVSGTFSLLCSRFFSPFLHSTGSLSVSREYLALRDGPRCFTQNFSCSALLRVCTRTSPPLRVQVSHLLWTDFPDSFHSLQLMLFVVHPSTPDLPKQFRFGLFRVRSPLLAESLLFSLPAGTEMFQFPAFAFLAEWQAFNLPGCPIRTSADQGLFAPPRGFSQLITSFFASESLGIHRLPFLTFFFRPTVSSLRHEGGWICAAGRSIFSLLVFDLLYFVSFSKLSNMSKISFFVENNGFEPLTLCVQSRCSSQLS